MAEKKDILYIRISVRNLVEFILRCGDLDQRGSGADRDAMQQGGRIHRKIQGRMGSNYEAEFSLKYLIEREAFHISVEGRADGILKEEGSKTDKNRIIIDEIKAICQDLELLKEPAALHLAQAKCYAYIYAVQHALEEITVRMTYVQMETEQIRYFYETYSIKALEEWFQGVMAEYEKWAQFQADWRQSRTCSISQIHFPFAYREQQRELVGGVYRTIEQKKRLFIQASTGAGKTIAVLYPSIQAIGRGMADKIFYLTAKTITRTVALETFRLLARQNLQFKSIVLTAKEKICFCEKPVCNPEACSYAKGHFDRVNTCMYDLLQKENLITSEILVKYAKQYRVCPFELSLDVSIWVDAIICDYNYVFDYDVCLKRFFGETASKEAYIFLIDEAHNLVERGREMYSAQIYKEDILEFRKQIKPYSHKIGKLLEKCNRKLLEWKKDCEQYKLMKLAELGDLAVLFTHLMGELDLFLEEVVQEELKEVVLEFYFKIRHFLNIYDGVDEHYVIYQEYEKEHFKVKLFCVNPSGNLQNFLDKGRATIFFSATLLPVKYYMKLLSGSTDDFAMYAQSPFQSENRLLIIGSDVSSRYSRRNVYEYAKVVDYIEAVIQARSGNYIVFLPSYLYMQAVYEVFLARNNGISHIIQENHMTENEREEFLQKFHENEGTLVAFCVLGGIFSEGIDLREDRLIGTIIVGTGMPQISTEREILKNYFEQIQGAGFDYAFRYPGFNKVLQAVGRVIRTERDKGVILLLEQRFLDQDYYELYPKEWQSIQVCNRRQIEEKLKSFWEKM